MDSAATAGRRRVPATRLSALVRRVPLVLAVLVVLGIELRVALSLSLTPAGMNAYDTSVYVGMAGGELFSDPARTAGYSLFLRAAHALSSNLDLTIAIQHLIGVATALLVYGAFRRLEAPIWVSAVGAAGVLLSLDQIFLEHSLLSESTFTFTLALTLYASARSLSDPGPLGRGLTTRHAWIVVAAVSLGLTAWMRSVVVPAVPLFALWFAFAVPGGWRVRLGRAGLAAGAAAAMLLAYAALQSAHNGYFGITPSAGWAFYARTAQFADCERFDPPAGAEELCETTPPADRPGPDFYAWEPESPARQLFGGQPNGNEELTAFARSAVLNQPLDYLRTAAADSLRYFFPGLDSRPFGGVGFEVIDIDRRPRGVESEINAAVNAYYDDDTVRARGTAQGLADLQQVLRMRPGVMIVVSVLGITGLALAPPGRLRAGLVLMLGAAAALLVIPPATAIWSARYSVPVTGPLLGCAAVGIWLIAGRIRERARPDRSAEPDPQGSGPGGAEVAGR